MAVRWNRLGHIDRIRGWKGFLQPFLQCPFQAATLRLGERAALMFGEKFQILHEGPPEPLTSRQGERSDPCEPTVPTCIFVISVRCRSPKAPSVMKSFP